MDTKNEKTTEAGRIPRWADPEEIGGMMGITTGGKRVSLGNLKAAQAQEDKEVDEAGDRMLEDITIAAAQRKKK